jgi:Flp pilus assembly pilin Flp
MSDLMLRTVTHTQVNARAMGQAIVRGAARAADRMRREQTGQDIVEYGGMLVLIAGVVAILFTLNVPETIGTAIGNALNSIFSGQSHTAYQPPAQIAAPK